MFPFCFKRKSYFLISVGYFIWNVHQIDIKWIGGWMFFCACSVNIHFSMCVCRCVCISNEIANECNFRILLYSWSKFVYLTWFTAHSNRSKVIHAPGFNQCQMWYLPKVKWKKKNWDCCLLTRVTQKKKPHDPTHTMYLTIHI